MDMAVVGTAHQDKQKKVTASTTEFISIPSSFIINYQDLILGNKVILKSVITCPDCRQAKEEAMPTDSCQWFYECSKCMTLLRPKAGDCCVFCSYGSVPCPPIQMEGKTGGSCCAKP